MGLLEVSRHGHDSVEDGRVGCAGWALSSAVSHRFPGEGSHLERYASVFSCVEINSSFYRPHQQKTYRRWADAVPATFRFSVKMPRAITHDLRLQQCDALVRAFMDEVAGLANKLGCILVQLPPSLALDVKIARKFFQLLRHSTPVPVSCEPRHASWFTTDADALFEETDVSRVWAHPAPVKGTEPLIESGLLYLRLHGAPQMYYSAYDASFIDGIASRMRAAREQGRDAWCIFDNTARGAAIPNALELVTALRQATPPAHHGLEVQPSRRKRN